MNIKRNAEPTFLGVSCSGKNLDRSKILTDQAGAKLMLAEFYKLDRGDQLIMAALTTEMLTDRRD